MCIYPGHKYLDSRAISIDGPCGRYIFRLVRATVTATTATVQFFFLRENETIVVARRYSRWGWGGEQVRRRRIRWKHRSEITFFTAQSRSRLERGASWSLRWNKGPKETIANVNRRKCRCRRCDSRVRSDIQQEPAGRRARRKRTSYRLSW